MTWSIRIKGQVQGVGFRPFVWRAALERNLKGWVVNGLEGVLIKINGTEQQALDFQQYILKNAPETARITDSFIEADHNDSFFENFSIRNSHKEGPPVLQLTPDVAMCAECRNEIRDPANRRYRYAFTTCTICGPRYSILTGVPYDRPFTTMAPFQMCPACTAEYTNPEHRRYYAQTNSCPDCGVKLQFAEASGLVNPDEIIAAWKNGNIVAIQGIGGFLLTCDATQPEAVALLRARKHRPTKPFAMMYPDVETLRRDAEITAPAMKHLQSPAAPIVLLDVLEIPASGFDRAGIAPGLSKIGAMLPNAPLFDLLLRDFGKPIVATSGNISHAPLVFEAKTASEQLSDIADQIVANDRAIVMPQDDSVLALCASGKSVMLRRARGLAPAFIQPGLKVLDVTVLALGAEMKSTFTLAHLGNINISQYLGDLADFDTQQRFQHVQEHLMGLFQAEPAVVIGDLHPAYFTTQLGERLANQGGVPFVQVQHHKAHFAAVLTENELFESEEPVLGIIWDGTGLGEDRQIWGGEFFSYSGRQSPPETDVFNRCGYFDYFPLLLGDKMPREPRLSALSVCQGILEAEPWLKSKFSETEWNLYNKLATSNTLKTSSAGRIFDAVASLLGLADKVSYEGEAALLLEDMARGYCKKFGFENTLGYPSDFIFENKPFKISTKNLFKQIIQDLDDGQERALIAARFHMTLVQVIEHTAQYLNIKKMAFSGGVFQNSLLLDMMEHRLPSNYQLYFHKQLSPNDENISFGQWAYATANGSLNKV